MTGYGQRTRYQWTDSGPEMERLCVLYPLLAMRVVHSFNNKLVAEQLHEQGLGDSIFMNRCLSTALLGAALIFPTVITPVALIAQEHRSYHDKRHNDDHDWSDHEDQAYRLYLRQNHRKYREFSTLKDNRQQAYWGWRHEHSDALLKIDIR